MIRVAIIGTGNIAVSHINAYLTFQDRCKVIALADIYPEKARAVKESFGLDAEVYDDYQKLFGRHEVDLVSICTPPYTHAEIAIDCMNHGIDVICEKPMAASLAECDAMIEARDRNGRRLSIISQNRYRSPIMKLKQTLDSGIAGKLLHAQVDSVWWRGHSYYDLWWRGTWEKEGGGCTLNHAVHHIDMLNWMKGLPKDITAVVKNLNHDNAEMEDFSIAVATYPDGSVSTMTSSLVHHGENQKFSFQCENAMICSPWNVAAYRSRPNGFGEPDSGKAEEIHAFYQALDDLKYEGHTGQIDALLTSIENGDQGFMVTAEDGRRTLEYITAVYKSGFSGQRVSLPLAKDDPYYTVEGIRRSVRKFHEKTASVENFKDDRITLGSDYANFSNERKK